MVMRDELEHYIEDRRETIAQIEVRPRDLSLDGSVEFLTSVFGPRRAGKSYLFYSVVKGEPNVLYLNFDDIQLRSWSADDIVHAITLYEEIYHTEPTHVVLDEVQRVNEWEAAVVTLYERKRYRIFVTGSFSKLMAREIASSLRGRTVTHLLLPLSFREYMVFHGYDTGLDQPLSTRREARVRSYLKEYLTHGSFPGLIAYPALRSKFYDDYVDLVLYRDLVERYGVSNTSVLRFILTAIIDSYAKEFSLNRLFNTWKSLRYKASKRTFYDYFSYLEEALFAFTLKKYARSRRTSDLSIPKVYLMDPALAPAIRGYEPGRAMENCVFLALLDHSLKEGGQDLYYWKDRSREVDFVICDRGGEGPRECIQVTYRLNATNRERELRPLMTVGTDGDRPPTRTVITWTGEEDAPAGVRVVALWQFLLHGQC